MQQHPRLPWIAFQPAPGGVFVRCTACGAQGTFAAPQADAFVHAHAIHQSASPSHFGLGDAVAAVASPVARALGKKPCTPCEARRAALNRLVPQVPLFRR